MTKNLLLFLLAFTFSWVYGQNKPHARPDTVKAKKGQISTAPTDSMHVMFPLNIGSARFDRLDSATLDAPRVNLTPAYSFVDTADLKMTKCGFEEEANAMVLVDNGIMWFDIGGVRMERHRRIKIFNDNGKTEATIKIVLNHNFGREGVLAIEGQTINLNNGRIEYTKLDPKLVYMQHIDAEKDELVFSMPDVKAGSIIEYRYAWQRVNSNNIPEWDFQCKLPTRYSQLQVSMSWGLSVSAVHAAHKKFAIDTNITQGAGHVWGLFEVPSEPHEPFMRSPADAVENLMFTVKSVNGLRQQYVAPKTWAGLGKEIAENKSFYEPFDQNLHDEGDLIKHAMSINNIDERIAFLFNQVKSLMQWNLEEGWRSKDGIKSAWKKKRGNWGEINMILTRLLTQSGIQACPMLVSTRNHGRIYPDFVDGYRINKLVSYVQVDSAKYYVLDASDKYSVWNEVPFDLLDSYGLYLNKALGKYDLLYLKKEEPVKQMVYITADIRPDGTMKGEAQITSYSYNKYVATELFKRLDDEKYRQVLTDGDNNLKITSLKIEDADVDSLPLHQDIRFNLDLPGADDKYIYFSPNLFTSLHRNPFISNERVSDIDFGFSNIYAINGLYKIPQGYKVDVMPKSMNLVMADKGITFKRIIGEDGGVIAVNYVIIYRKSEYSQAQYPDIYMYFKKMTETLNEQIVLKKQ